MKVVAEPNEKKRKRMLVDPQAVVVLVVLLPSTTWCIPHLGISYADRKCNRTGAIAHNSNCGNSSSSNSTMLLPHHRSRLSSGHHSSFSRATFHASTTGRWGTLLENGASRSKATHRELRHLWSISRGANRRVLHHGLAAPTTPPWRRFSWENLC
jgi:hypothetical protein